MGMDLITGLVTLGAPLIGGLFGSSGQESANRTNIQLGREQMEFQERMSNTAYQRAIKDMSEAGLNPMLAYSQGGASAPMGSMPQVQNANSAAMTSAAGAMSVVQGLQSVAQSAAATEKLKAETDQVRASTLERELYSAKGWAELLETHERTRRHWTGGELDLANRDVLEWVRKLRELDLARDKDTFSADVAARRARSKLLQLEIPRAQAEGKWWEKMDTMPQALKTILLLLQGANSARSALK